MPFRFAAVAFAGLAALAAAAPAADWKPAPAPLMTRWGKEVSPDKQPWPEYPRPQMVRKDWLNLNGLWDYAVTPKGTAKPEKWDGKILVPFCIESALSGVGKRVTPQQNLWYHTTVTAPAGWVGKRVLLHFDAVDWETTVFVNGKELLAHKGGFDPFTVDVTDALKDGTGELVLRVWDPTDSGSQPRGKQVSKPGGIWYTPVTGVWQTVWLEPVPETHITSVRFTPDIDAGEVEVFVNTTGPADSVQIFWAIDGHKPIPEGANPAALFMFPTTGTPGKPFRIRVDNAKLWSPDSPTIYDAHLSLIRGDKPVDIVDSYFAMRKVHVDKDGAGVARVMLNNKPLFQLGPLDQGWWPDGLLTPPSDAAMRYDLDVLKKLGMNMLRKHIKVEPSRLYRYCDEIGLLVWQDMPSGAIEGDRKQWVSPNQKTDGVFTPAQSGQFNAELKAMIEHLRFFPCIVAWVPFNEGWGQHDTNAVLKWTKEYDPTRLTNGPSGWEDRGYGDMKDMHNYPGPGMFPAMADRASVLGEFGGLGLPLKGHLWKDTDNWGYRTYKDTAKLRTEYRQLVRKLHPLIGRGLSAAVYTQTTDVEVEVNGLMTYDRAVLKFDVAETAGWHKELFGPPPVSRDLVPTSEQTAQKWRYTTTKPAVGWEKPDAAVADWPEGDGGFGTRVTPGAVVRTEWTTADIWARRTFDLAAMPTGEVSVRLHHDEDAEVYVNGVLAARVAGYTSGYDEVPISAAARAALKTGRNVLAVHCHQTGGGQYIDVGLVEVVPAPAGR